MAPAIRLCRRVETERVPELMFAAGASCVGVTSLWFAEGREVRRRCDGRGFLTAAKDCDDRTRGRTLLSGYGRGSTTVARVCRWARTGRPPDGGAGNETLVSAMGDDSPTGGAGNDKFEFASESESGDAGTGDDTILDFTKETTPSRTSKMGRT